MVVHLYRCKRMPWGKKTMSDLQHEFKSVLRTLQRNSLMGGELETVMYMDDWGMLDEFQPEEMISCIERYYRQQQLDQDIPVNVDHATRQGAFLRFSEGFARHKLWKKAVLCMIFAWRCRDRSAWDYQALLNDMDALAQQCLDARRQGTPAASSLLMGGLSEILQAAQTTEPDIEAAGLAFVLYGEQGDVEKLVAQADRLAPRIEELCLWQPITDALVKVKAKSKLLTYAQQWEAQGKLSPAIDAYAKGGDSYSILRIVKKCVANDMNILNILEYTRIGLEVA